jgi:hypothetical protein
MLNVTFFIKSNVRIKNSKARLMQLYRRFVFFKILLLTEVLGTQINIMSVDFSLKSSYRKHKITLLRSPFHYKTSKSLLANPEQYLIVSVNIESTTMLPVFTSSFFNKISAYVNRNNIFVIEKIKIRQLC